jgi:DNA-binding GntR family transcriptional regulator
MQSESSGNSIVCFHWAHFRLEGVADDKAMSLIDSPNLDPQQSAEDRTQAIRDQLRDAIVDRRLAPGTKLSEGEVGSLFDVSRTVARAALQMLGFEGLVRIERNRGAFVANPDPEEARQVFAARRLVEPGIAAEACVRATPADLAAMRAHLVEEARHMNARGPSARRAEIRASGEFHLLLAAAAGNAIMHRFMEELIARSSLVIALYGRSGASSCGHGEHGAIVDALARRDAAGVQELVSQHIDHIEHDLDLTQQAGASLKAALRL